MLSSIPNRGGVRGLALGLSAAFVVCASGRLDANEPPAQATSTPPQDELTAPWMEPIPVPSDPELEDQILEVQEAIGTLHQQIVRRKALLEREQESGAKAQLRDELKDLQEEREDLEAILDDLVEEARASQRTAIDEALARARSLERQQEYRTQQEELIRDRQE
jgi:hypothetical protein